MSSTKRSSNEAYKQRQAQPKPQKTDLNKGSTGWATKGAAVATLLGACIAAAVGLQNLLGHLPAKPDTQIEPDNLLSIIKINEEQYELRLNLGMVNYGDKSDLISRPQVALTSDKSVIECAPYAVFADQQGKDPFPLILEKDSKEHLTCIIKWTPTRDYDNLASGKLKAMAASESAVIGRIELTWKERYRQSIERLFLLVAAEDIRGMKPGEPRLINCFHLGGESSAQDRETPSFGPQYKECLTASMEGGGVAHLAAIGMNASPPQEAKSHYAVQGEIAAGKEVPSATPKQAIINLRPCGGGDDLVIFREPFRKRFMGSLPCGVSVVQIEKL